MQTFHLIAALALILIGVVGNIESQRHNRARRSSGFIFYAITLIGISLLIAHSARYSVAWGPQAWPFAMDCTAGKCVARITL